MMADEGPRPPAAEAAPDELAAHVRRVFRHAGEHPAADMLRELILRYRREQAGGDGRPEHGHE